MQEEELFQQEQNQPKKKRSITGIKKIDTSIRSGFSKIKKPSFFKRGKKDNIDEFVSPVVDVRKANTEIFLMTAVETPEAVENLDEILKVEGLDGIFIGPMDLATSMGHFGDPTHPDVQSVIREVENKVAGSNKILSTVAGSWEDALAKYGRGYQILLLMSDTLTLGKVARGLVQQFKEAFPER